MYHISQLPFHPGLWRIEAETVGYLLVRGERSLLIDCPAEDLTVLLKQAGLPLPDTILHTQVQEEHCREWAAFPSAHAWVYAESSEVARISEQYKADCQTVWPPTRDWSTKGEEKYGIAGCVTERAPRKPLNLAGVLHAGETFRWEDVALEVIPLPGSGKRSIGLYWRDGKVIFSGDLLHAGGYLVNMYDLERNYNLATGYDQLRESLQTIMRLQPGLLLPTAGPPITSPREDCSRLLERIAWVKNLPTRRDGEASVTNYTPLREFGGYREIIPGVFQCNAAGNIILFVDREGRGMMIDPDICVWLSWEENCREMHAVLDLLEREAGLRRVELAVITHYHGDHVQYCDLLRERYGTKILATPDVAEVMEHPVNYNLPATIAWYAFPFDHIDVDRRLAYEQPFDWHGVAITPIHTPGHCYAHTGYFLVWNGARLACSGDSLIYGSGPISPRRITCYNDTAWPERGSRPTIDRLIALRPAYVLGGHGHSFHDPDGSILRDFRTVIEESERLAAAMLYDGDLKRGMTPPGFEKIVYPGLTDCAKEVLEK
ncbi:MAG: MBL fold metallo-hydrolase [Armatimonadota bacterium]